MLCNTVKSIIDGWDPVGLIRAHAPMDEYSPEVEEIYNLLQNSQNISLESLSINILKIFLRSFGEDAFKAPQTECNIIAKELLDSAE